jgi:predicted GNAT family N-acyltransferase
MSNLKFKVATTQKEFDEVLKIRHSIFVVEQGIPKELDHDGKDKDSIHLLVYSTDEIIASGRLTIQKQDGVLSQIVVKATHRSFGIGKKLVLEFEQITKEMDVKNLSLTPHAYLEKFYTNLGYQKTNKTEKVDKYELLKMIKTI